MYNIFAILLSTILFFTSSINVENIEENTMEKTVNEQRKKNIGDNKENECYNEEIQEANEISNYSTNYYNYHDEYEYNGTIETASSINPTNFHTMSSYYNNIQGTLYNDGCVDHDYYYFVLLNDSEVVINVSTDSQISFDFILSNYTYNIESNIANRELNDIATFDNSHGYISFSDTLLAGTYFIYLKGNHSYDSNLSISYILNFNVVTAERSEYITGKDILDNVHQTVVWLSDLVPANYLPFLNFNQQIIYYQYNESGIDDPEYCLDYLKEISNGDPIHMATYYISDPVVKYTLYQMLVAYEEIFDLYIDEKEEEILNFELYFDITEKVMEITFETVNDSIPDLYISFGLDITQYISMAVLEKLFDVFTPKITSLDIDTGKFLSYYKGCFEPAVSSNSWNYEDIIKYYANGEIIAIPIYYSLRETGSSIPRFNKHYISYVDTYSMISGNSFSTKFLSDYKFYSNQENSYYSQGKFYNVNIMEELSSTLIIKNSTNLEHNHSYSIYEYDDSNEHKVYCHCDDYIFENHNFINTEEGKYCSGCNYHTHTYTYMPSGDGKKHLKQCLCGYSVSETCIGLSNGIFSICGKCGQELEKNDGPILTSTNDDIVLYVERKDELLV